MSYSVGDEVEVIRGPWSGFVCRLEARDADNGWVVSFPGLVTKSGFVFDSELSPPAEPADTDMDWVCSENRRLTHERDRLRVELAETKKAMGTLADERDHAKTLIHRVVDAFDECKLAPYCSHFREAIDDEDVTQLEADLRSYLADLTGSAPP